MLLLTPGISQETSDVILSERCLASNVIITGLDHMYPIVHNMVGTAGSLLTSYTTLKFLFAFG